MHNNYGFLIILPDIIRGIYFCRKAMSSLFFFWYTLYRFYDLKCYGVRFVYYFQKKYCKYKKSITFAPAFEKYRNVSVDSLAQQVEHIPFKDGVLGSNPRRITLFSPTG